MDASCKLPAGYESQWPQLVLATLDVNQGQDTHPYGYTTYIYPWQVSKLIVRSQSLGAYQCLAAPTLYVCRIPSARGNPYREAASWRQITTAASISGQHMQQQGCAEKGRLLCHACRIFAACLQDCLNVCPRLQRIARCLHMYLRPSRISDYLSYKQSPDKASIICLQGFVKQLLHAAVIEGVRDGVEWLYVHAAVTNTAAISLYSDACCFEKEQEEGENEARLQRRPRRLLFRKQLC